MLILEIKILIFGVIVYLFNFLTGSKTNNIFEKIKLNQTLKFHIEKFILEYFI